MLLVGVSAGCSPTTAVVVCLLRGSFPILASMAWLGC